MAQANVLVRLSIKDADVVRTALQSLGADGEKALKRIEAAGRTPSPGLKALGAASDELKGKFGELGSRTGVVGDALSALGPRGLVAAAGIGAMVAGFAALMVRTRQAIDQLDDLGDKAAKIGVSAEYLQEMRYSLEQLGVPVEAVDGALAAFQVTVGKVGLQGDEAAKKIRIAFEALHISLDDVQKSDPTALLQRVATEISKVGDTARQAAIAKALGIEELLPALREGGDAIAGLREDARRLGIVLDEDLVQNAGRAKNELDTMQRVIDAQLTQALVNATPLVVTFAKGFATVAEMAGRAVDRLKEVEQRSTHTLKVEIDDLDRQIALQEKNVAAAKAPRNLLERGLAGVGLNRPQDLEVQQAEGFLGRLREERARRQAALDEREQRPKGKAPSSGGGTIDLGGDGDGRGGGGDAGARAAEQAQRAYEANERVIGDLARQIVAFGDARRQFVDQALSRLSESATNAQWGEVEEAANKLYDLKEAQEQATEAARERQAVEDEGARITEAMRTPAEQYAATLAHLNDLQAAGAITAETHARAITEAKDALDRTNAKAVDTGKSVLDLSSTFQGFGQVATSAFEDAIVKGEKLSTVLNGLAQDMQRLLIRATMNKLIGLGIDALGSALGGGLFGDSAGYGTTGAGANLTSGGTNPGFLLGGAAHGAAFAHGNVIPFARGGLVDRPTLFPMARGMGLMGEAGPEAVLPLRRTPSGDLGVQAGGGPNVTINVINNAGAKVTTQQRKDPDGRTTIDVMVDAVESAMAQRMTRPGTTLNRAYRSAADPIRAR